MSTAAVQTERKIDWPILIGVIGLHALALLAIPFYSWQGVVCFFLHYIVVGNGVTVGYHRLLTHESFETYPWIRNVFTILGVLSGQGPPIKWVADHRKHHKFSDSEGDPHSPKDGFLHSHWLWTIWAMNESQLAAHYRTYVPKLIKEPLMRKLNGRLYIVCHFLMASMLALAGFLIGGWWMAVSLVVWGYVLRMVWVFHVTWGVNSIAHRFGYRNFQTADESRNNWLIGLLAWGEGWHNNHHAFPTSASHGFYRWWEIDLSFVLIYLLEKCHLAWNVKRPFPPRPG